MIASRRLERTAAVAVGFLAVAMVAAPAPAQDAADGYGIYDVTTTLLMASSFTPRSSSETYDDDIDGWRNTTGFGASPYAAFRAGLNVPTGARLAAIELEACDTDPATAVSATLFICDPFAGGLCAPMAGVDSPGTSGCGRFSSSMANLVMDNRNRSYFVEVWDPSVSATTRFRAVRISWRRQVSPAPAQATFGDVPTTHFAFQYVEALARARITGGCSPTDFCPDAPMTRAQMAVFLSLALGLHWPD